MSGRRPFRLLPADSPVGWTPYAWLFYLPTFLIQPVLRTTAGSASVGYWIATVAALLVFLVAYFIGYWVRGRRLVLVIAVIATLAVVYAPSNVGACVFFVYAASFAGYHDDMRLGLRLIIMIALAALVTALLTSPPLFFWITGVGITLLVGGVNLHFNQVGRANRKLRLAQEEVEHLAAVAERERIARDLHDVLGHTLSLIVLKSELAARVADRDPGRAAAEMREVEDVARRTLQDVREAIRGYRATLIEEAARARAMLKAAGVACELELPDAELPAAVEETLAFALREGITNVVRHAAAERCSVRISVDGNAARLSIADDGRGSSAPDGSGLRGMRERVEAFGGSVSREHDRGTRITVRIPLPARVHA